jgi:hypothetical protein
MACDGLSWLGVALAGLGGLGNHYESRYEAQKGTVLYLL